MCGSNFTKKVNRICHSMKIDKDIKLVQIRARGRVNVLELKDIFLEMGNFFFRTFPTDLCIPSVE
jgi:hypothetical protein